VTFNYEREVYEQTTKWRGRAQEVPYLKFPESWEVRITPPFGRADARFSVKSGKATVSVYLDFDGNLGYMDQPYWEIHPLDGDCARYYLNETDDLLAGIAQSIEQQNATKDPTHEQA